MLKGKLHELQRLEYKIKKQIHNMHFQSIRKYKIAVSPYKALQHVTDLCPDMYNLHAHPQKLTKYLNLYINIWQIYTLEQQVQSTSYPHYVHQPCNVKLKSYSIFTFRIFLLTFFTIFYSKKTFATEKKYQ